MQNAFGNSKNKDEIVCLSFYEDPPVAPLSLESFESYALDRLMGMKLVIYYYVSIENNRRLYS